MSGFSRLRFLDPVKHGRCRTDAVAQAAKIARILASILTGNARDDSPTVVVPFPGDEKPNR